MEGQLFQATASQNHEIENEELNDYCMPKCTGVVKMMRLTVVTFAMGLR